MFKVFLRWERRTFIESTSMYKFATQINVEEHNGAKVLKSVPTHNCNSILIVIVCYLCMVSAGIKPSGKDNFSEQKFKTITLPA